MMSRLAPLIAGWLLFGGMCGCGGDAAKNDDAPAAPDPVQLDDTTTNDVASIHSVTLGRMVFLPLTGASDVAHLESALARLETPAAQSVAVVGFSPAGCAALSRPVAGGNVIHVQFDDCAHSVGLSKLSGGLDATFTDSDGYGVSAQLSGDADLTANGSAIQYAAAVSFVINGDERTFTWDASWAGLTSKGHAVSHQSVLSVTLTADASGDFCSEIAGTTDGSVDQRGLETMIDQYKVCPLLCPRSGLVTSTRTKTRETMFLRFDGSPDVRVTTPAGALEIDTLSCAEL